MEQQELSDLIRNIKANTKLVQLLKILSNQLKSLINTGQTDLHSLLLSIRTEKLLTDEECDELLASFPLEAVSSALIQIVFGTLMQNPHRTNCWMAP